MNKGMKWTLIGLGVAGLGVGGWVQLRLYTRREVLKALNAPTSEGGYNFDKKLQSNPILRIGADLLDVPTAEELAESTTPIWSTIHPYDAFDDILQKGRESIYWPAHRQSSLPAAVDTLIFSVLRSFSEAQKRKEAQKLIG